MKERDAERALRHWLQDRRYRLDDKKAGASDIAALRGREHWCIEVKGDQMNERALRNAFFSALGQVACVPRTVTHRSIALTPQYEPLIDRHRDVIDKSYSTACSIILVRDDGACPVPC